MKLTSQALKLAHEIYNQFKTWRDALRAAWKIILIKAGRATEVTFTKESTGELRTAKAIAISSLKTIEKGFVRFVEQVSEGRTQWRSFKLKNLIFEDTQAGV